MRALDVIGLSLRNSLRQKRRFAPGIVGVSLAVLLTVSAVSAVTTVFQTSVSAVLDQQSLKTISVTEQTQTMQISQASPQMYPAVVAGFQHMPHVESAYPVLRSSTLASVGNLDFGLVLANLPSVYDRPALLQGRWATSSSEIDLPDYIQLYPTSENQPAAVPRNYSTRTLMSTWIKIAFQVSNDLGDSSYQLTKVVGLYDPGANHPPMPDSFVSLSVVEHSIATSRGLTDKDYQSQLSYTMVIVDVDQAVNVAAVANDIQRKGYAATYLEQTIQGLSARLKLIEFTAVGLASLIALVAILSIVNTQNSLIAQRRSEFGIMLALGFSRRDMGAIVMCEALAVGLLGLLFGLSLALLANVGFVLYLHTQQLSVQWWLVWPITAAVLLLVALSSLAPAFRAMNTDVVAIVRGE